jgi:hypothetical protein
VQQNFIRVRYQAGQIIVETVGLFGLLSVTQTLVQSATLGNGDTLTALANIDGSVDVWTTTAANVTTFVGRSTASGSFTGGGRIGMQLNNGARVDNFAGGTVA